MGVGNTFSTLSRLLDRWDGDRFDVVEVKPREVGVVSAGAVTVDVDLAVPFGPGFGDDTALSTAVDDGTLSLEFSGHTRLVPPDLDADGLSVTPQDSRVRPDGTVLVSFSVTVSDEMTGDPNPAAIEHWVEGNVVDGRNPTADGGREISSGSDVSGSDRFRRRRDVPPYEDTEYLQQLYDACDTFAEMADEFEMDVTSETVRRYMIDAGVHDPTSYDTGSDAGDARSEADDGSDSDSRSHSDSDSDSEFHSDSDSDSAPDPDRNAGGDPDLDLSSDRANDHDVEVLVTDGIGLPDGMTVDEFIRTIEQSNTLYDIQQRMGVERARAREMLEDLDLLDLVVGRLSTQAERSVSREDVVERLREQAAH